MKPPTYWLHLLFCKLAVSLDRFEFYQWKITHVCLLKWLDPLATKLRSIGWSFVPKNSEGQYIGWNPAEELNHQPIEHQ